MGDDKKKRRPRRKFSDEFKRDAVELVRPTGKPIAQVAEELGLVLDVGELGSSAPARAQREGLTSADRARLRQLEAENAELRMERDLLKRTVAFWGKESTP